MTETRATESDRSSETVNWTNTVSQTIIGTAYNKRVHSNSITLNPSGNAYLETFPSLGTYGVYKMRYPATYRFSLGIKINNPSNKTVIIRVNNGDTLLNFFVSTASVIDYTGAITSAGSAGSFCYLTIQVSGGGSEDVIIQPNYLFQIECESDYSLFYSSPFICRVGLPKMKQTDFLKAILQIGFLIPQIDNVNKKITFRNYREIKANMAQDFTDKFVSLKSTAFKFGEWGQSTEFKYESDKQSENFYGSGYIGVTNQLLEPIKEMVKVPFSASLEVDRFVGVVPFAYIPIYDSLTEFRGGAKPRILIPHNLTAPINALNNDGSVASVINTQMQSGVFDYSPTESIAFNQMIPSYGMNLSEIVQQMKVCTVEVYINLIDYIQFDFMRPVYIQQLSSFFYCNKINAYEEGKTCTLELIKL